MDATTSASIVVENDLRYGTTEYVANMIAEKVGGHLERIETGTRYTADFDELRDVNHDEMSRNDLPELKRRSGYFRVRYGIYWLSRMGNRCSAGSANLF